MIKITGNIPKMKRLLTSMYSFDRAFENQQGDIGFPLGSIVEVFGKHSTGKSTFANSLAGIIAEYLKCDITLLDLEGSDPDFLVAILSNSGFDGELHYLQAKEDETAMDLLVSTVGDKKKNFGVGILDSIGAISPLSEAEGDLGEANMGKRAKLLGQFSRKSNKLIREYKDEGIQKTFFLINHQLPVLGGRGTYTPGGLAKEYLSSVRIQLSIAYGRGKYEIFPDMSYVLKGIVTKNKMGMKNREFYVVMLNGKGIHKGLTWMYDGWMNKLVDRQGFIGNIKVGDKQMGKMRNVVEKAHEGDDEYFEIFRAALDNYQNGGNHSEEDENTEDGDIPSNAD